MKKLVNESLVINEGFATEEGRKLNKISSWLGYDDFEEFLGDNPGCYEVITEWIDEYFGEKLAQDGFEPEELENMGLYGSAEQTRELTNEG